MIPRDKTEGKRITNDVILRQATKSEAAVNGHVLCFVQFSTVSFNVIPKVSVTAEAWASEFKN